MNIRGQDRCYTWGEIVYKPQSTYGPRRQIHYQLMLVHSGSVVVETDGVTTHMRGGEVALMDRGPINLFRFSAEVPTHHSWIHARPVGDPDPWESYIQGAMEVRSISRRMGFLVGELLRGTQTEQPVRESLFATLAEAAFLEFLAGGDLRPAQERGHPSLERAIEHMRMTFGEPCVLGDLGRVSGMSPQHLTRLFKKETGMTPMRYLWSIREEEGLRLLRETGLTIAEVADICGFQNPYHFSRRIRERYGHSPLALRKRIWKVR